MAGVDPAKWHDVGEILVSELRQDRERAMYGDDIQKLPPQRLFDAAAAAGALKGAETVMAVCERLMAAA